MTDTTVIILAFKWWYMPTLLLLAAILLLWRHIETKGTSFSGMKYALASAACLGASAALFMAGLIK